MTQSIMLSGAHSEWKIFRIWNPQGNNNYEVCGSTEVTL